jgi:hypothetical protein
MNSVFDRPTTGRKPTWFDEHAVAWVEHGLVTSEQVEAIRTYEQAHVDARPRLPLGAELAVYLGSVVALMSGAMIVARSWENLVTLARVGVGLALVALGFAAGARLRRLGDDARTRRLVSFMWLIGTGGVALVAGTIADTARFEDPGWNLVIIGAPVLTLGAVLWRNLDRPLQVVTTAVGAGLVVGGTGAVLAVPAWVGGIVVWTAAVAIGVAAVTQRLRPELYVLGVAAVTAMIGALMLVDVGEVFGTAAATVTAGLVVATGLARRQTPILVIGVLAFLQSLQGLLMTVLNGAVAALAVAVAGIAVVIVVIVRSTRRGAAPRPDQAPSHEPTGGRDGVRA